MALPAAFLDEVRARTPMHALVSRTVKLTRSGKSSKGCCPFHGEKTPSFYVYDDGYHCFGCGAHGDAISFVMNTQGSSFIDTVTALASEAGLEVPQQSPAAAEAERQRLDLTDVLDLVAGIYQRRLFERDGAEALAYLRGRGLTDDTIRRFGLGWCGDGRGLIAELARSGIDPARMAEAGLLQSRDDGAVRELFYNRVMFPIRDRRGRTISFGGRALGDAKPKYINGPETGAFSKRRSLYALDFAREGARSFPVVVVEGYMDVIALHQAGFGGAVAPLGTALTAEQLEEIWRLSDAPTICLDGDVAGSRAASRVAEVALPKLTMQRTLRFASLPTGEDPDSLLKRSGGSLVIEQTITHARPFHLAMYEFAHERFSHNSPEGRAAFKNNLGILATLITDKNLAFEYKKEWNDRYFEERKIKKLPKKVAFIRSALRADHVYMECKRNICAIILTHPFVLENLEEAFCLLSLPETWAGIRTESLNWWHNVHDLDSGALLNHLSTLAVWPDVEEVLNPTRPLPLATCIKPDAMPFDIERSWYHFFEFIRKDGIEAERNEALREWARDGDPAVLARALGLHGALERLVSDIGDGPD